MTSHQLNPPLSLDSLYCEEEQWDNNGEINESNPKNFCAQGEGESILEYRDLKPTPFVKLLEQNVSGEDEELSALLLREKENELYDGCLESPCLAKERREAVEWMLRVVGYYSFSAQTAEKVEECCSLIQDVVTSLHLLCGNKRKFGSLPGSPKGVVDASFSSESSNDSWTEEKNPSVSSSPEPLSKKIKSNFSSFIT
ncbi:hypothetical protein F511_01352 [Dorcoceras hygrometricum]|uniref:Uncharacterized protein n=1 Tax=Dorcoceras hygrometricum TaxID=472368 RepID=A0A2Z7D4I1_9LAMI|nr:hypothetical protein F511_01352 [Dorcoceras hygrometricum]